MNQQANFAFIEMKPEQTEFFKQIGQRMTQLRKEQGLTQQELADLLGVKQYVVASYETGRRRVPVSLLPDLAKSLGVSAEELLGERNGHGKRGPSPRLQRQIEQLRRLPPSKQRFVSEFLDTVLQRAAT